MPGAGEAASPAPPEASPPGAEKAKEVEQFWRKRKQARSQEHDNARRQEDEAMSMLENDIAEAERALASKRDGVERRRAFMPKRLFL